MISPEDLRKEAEQIDQTETDETSGRRPSRFFLYILATILVLMLILMIVPRYAVKLDPRPGEIPGPEIADGITIPDINVTRGYDGFLTLSVVRPDIKRLADKLAATCRESGYSKVCYAKAMYEFTQQVQYVGDPPDEYLKSPEETLTTMTGDCDDHSILLGTLLSAVGIRSRFAFIPNHVFVQAYIPDALSRYKGDDDWITLDATCKSCEFGEVPVMVAQNGAPNRYLYI